jgi:hypothetical protein
MDSIEFLSNAKKEINLADHIYYVALPVVKDKKVFLSILNHLERSLLLAMRAYIINQKEKKKIRIIPESESLIVRLFFEEFSDTLSIKTSEKHIVKEILTVAKAYRKSQAEIKRGEDYIIFLPNFDTVTINEQNMKRYLSLSKTIINKIEEGIKNG